jgi:hypothetical protein
MELDAFLSARSKGALFLLLRSEEMVSPPLCDANEALSFGPGAGKPASSLHLRNIHPFTAVR